jgi:prepilin-type N-terminal cleavage/methylation domain-containing protein
MKQLLRKKMICRGNQDGFTLIEALVAIAIFSVGILATVSMQVASMNGNRSAMETTEAATEAASAVESLKPLDYMTDAALSQGTTNLPDVDQYSASYTIQDNAIIPNTKAIQVTVTWTEGSRQRSVVLDYIKADLI